MADNKGDDLSPMAVAMFWVSQITTVVLEMVLPGLGGTWLDHRFGTGFLALAGFALGLTLGIWHLLNMTKAGPPVNSDTGSSNRDSDGHKDRQE